MLALFLGGGFYDLFFFQLFFFNPRKISVGAFSGVENTKMCPAPHVLHGVWAALPPDFSQGRAPSARPPDRALLFESDYLRVRGSIVHEGEGGVIHQGLVTPCRPAAA